MAATVVLLVGTSSAGKSTLAGVLQATLPEHYLLLAWASSATTTTLCW